MPHSACTAAKIKADSPLTQPVVEAGLAGKAAGFSRSPVRLVLGEVTSIIKLENVAEKGILEINKKFKKYLDK